MAADVASELLHQKGCHLLGDQNATLEQCQASKRVPLCQRKLLNASCFILWHFSVVSKREWAHQLYAGRTPVSVLLMSSERKEMKERRLNETKSSLCLCELPFSSLKAHAVGNYSAGEPQSFKPMCNHKSEPDIKTQSYHIWFPAGPWKCNCWDHCVSAASMQSLICLPPASWLHCAGQKKTGEKKKLFGAIKWIHRQCNQHIFRNILSLTC